MYSYFRQLVCSWDYCSKEHRPLGPTGNAPHTDSFVVGYERPQSSSSYARERDGVLTNMGPLFRCQDNLLQSLVCSLLATIMKVIVLIASFSITSTAQLLSGQPHSAELQGAARSKTVSESTEIFQERFISIHNSA